jgi:hypothetical protein
LIILLWPAGDQFILGFGEFLLGLFHAAVADLGHFAEVAFALAWAASCFNSSIWSLALLIFSTSARSLSQRALKPSRLLPLSSAISLFSSPASPGRSRA